MKEIDVNGLIVRDYALKESLNNVNDYLREPRLHSIAYVSNSFLQEVGMNKEKKDYFKLLDMTVCDETIEGKDRETGQIALAGGKGNDFFETVLRNIAAQSRGIYLIGEDENEIENIKNFILSYDGNAKFSGYYIFSKNSEIDDLFNDINNILPSAIITNLPWLYQGKLIAEGRRMLAVSVWIGILPSMVEANIKKQEVTKKYWWREIWT